MYYINIWIKITILYVNYLNTFNNVYILQLWKELLDKIIYEQHDGYGPDAIHKTDLDPSKVCYFYHMAVSLFGCSYICV